MQNRLIDFGEADGTVVVGITRSGKTYGALHSLTKQPKGVLFVNTNDSPCPRGWTRANLSSDTDDMADELIGGGKVCYTPDRRYRQQEVGALISWLFHVAGKDGLDILVAVDEVHLYKGNALNACRELATTGIRHGLQPVWISQRPALIDNTLITQSTGLVAYDLSQAEMRWLKEYRYPHDEIFRRLKEGNPDPRRKTYGYVTFNGREVEGPFKVAT